MIRSPPRRRASSPALTRSVEPYNQTMNQSKTCIALADEPSGLQRSRSDWRYALEGQFTFLKHRVVLLAEALRGLQWMVAKSNYSIGGQNAGKGPIAGLDNDS